jgi:ubiquinone/menaquinone biosynthesis C-methylase UbiE
MDKYLQETWDILADSWTNVRAWPYPEVKGFSKKVEKGLVVDIACGNCRNLLPFTKKSLPCVGMDFSRGMIKEAKKYAKRKNMKIDLIIGDLTNLPFKEDVASTIIYTSSITHLRTKKERLKSLEESKRIGKEDFRMILSIWNRWQLKFLWKLLKAFLFGKYPNVYVDWNYHGVIHKRFYHLYSKKEMLKDLEKVGLKTERIIKDDHGGIWFWVRR